MPTAARIALLTGVTLAGPGLDRAFAQTPDSMVCRPKHQVRAVTEALAVNVAVSRWDAWARGQPWADVGSTSWSSNIRLGWEWDENEFGTNMFSHPFHGSLYFNAGTTASATGSRCRCRFSGPGPGSTSGSATGRR